MNSLPIHQQNHYQKVKALRHRLTDTLPRDRRSLLNHIRLFERSLTKKSDESTIEAAFSDIGQRLERAMDRKNERIQRKPQLRYPESLPIMACKAEIIDAIRRHSVVVIAGETGSGKTTQIPKFCLEAGRGIDGIIGCTQPRRIAAVSIARRIAEEIGDPEGTAIGYQVRFQDRTHKDAYIKVMTDGILLAESQKDRLFYRYDTLIVDEAHERSLNIDFILGLLRRILKKRDDLKVIITSATIDTEKFSKAFDDAPVLEVSGRLYPVTVEYRPLRDEDTEDSESPNDAPTHVEKAVEAVLEIHKRPSPGDILVFMPTEQDIRETCSLLEKRIVRNAVILPLYARLTADRQSLVFGNTLHRKIIVASNIAETSLTIPGIRYVVDTGLARISRYIPRSRTTSLPVSPISRASADQRKGRCGRVADGICIRLYSEADYLSRPEFTLPEIQRANLADVILRMVVLGIDHAAEFPFIDPPDARAVRDGYEQLFELGALIRSDSGSASKHAKDEDWRLTDTGLLMARFPLDPRLTRILIESAGEGCLEEASVLVAALSIQDPRERPSDQADKADQAQREFVDPLSDFITLFNIWEKFQAIWEAKGRLGLLKKFCRDHFLSFRRMREWRDIHEQVLQVVDEQRIQNESTHPAGRKKRPGPFSDRYGAIHRSILSGFLSNIAYRKEKNMFLAAKSRSVMIFPGSGLFNRAAKWIVAAEVVETSRPFARTVAAIDPEWLEPIGKDLCRFQHFDPRWDRKRGEVIVTEQVSLFGLIIIPGRAVAYGRIDPEAATDIFIRSALIDQDIDRLPGFLKENRKLVTEIRRMEDKVRRKDLLVSEETVMAYYRSRLNGVFDIRTLNRKVREKGEGFLLMSREDLLQKDPDAGELMLYPDQLAVAGSRFACDYRFTPGDAMDGVTVRVPSVRASNIPDGALEWVVPGLLLEKISALLKGLPKPYRKKLVPIQRTADLIMREMPKSDESLTHSLARFIHHRFDLSIPAEAWMEKALPDHLRTRITITDGKGRTVRSGRDPMILKSSMPETIDPASLERARKAWEREKVISWDFGDLPEMVEIDGADRTCWPVFPCLFVSVKDSEAISLKLFTDRERALSSHTAGVAALFAQRFLKDFKFLRRSLSAANPVPRKSALFGGDKAFLAQMVLCVQNQLFRLNIRTQEAFDAICDTRGSLILSAGADLLQAVTPVVAAYEDALQTIRGIGSRAGRGHPLEDLSLTLIKDLEILLPDDFLKNFNPERFPRILRYLRAAALRMERAGLDIEKDRVKASRTLPFIEWHRNLKANAEKSSNAKIDALDEFYWMLEEFKVSVFAQELGTVIPVSEKRLKEKMGEIERMM
jgi:ATP-dependent helicase HrpA